MDYGREVYQALHRPPFDTGMSEASREYVERIETEKEEPCQE
jgi:hypothetical protein